MSKKILVTGGAGFIGSNLVVQLVKEGYFVRVLDNLNPQVHGLNKNTSYTYQLIKDKVDFIEGDILSKKNVFDALGGMDVLIHMAAETGTGRSMYDVTLHTEANINGLANLYEQIYMKKSIFIYSKFGWFANFLHQVCSFHKQAFFSIKNV